MAEKIDFKLDEESFFKKHQQNQNMPKNDALKQIMLKRIMRDFEPGRVYSELKVNEIINKYFKDFALIRRELVNFRYMGRDSINDKYWVIKKELLKEDFMKITRLKQHACELGLFRIA